MNIKSNNRNYGAVAIIIVTYNRSNLLERCLESLLAQRSDFDTIFVIDNASSDDTPSLFSSSGKYGNQDFIEYVRMNSNVGGAGGFHEGLKRSFEEHDYAILMDDDGCPGKEMVRNLTQVSIDNGLHFTSTLVVDEKDHTQLAFKVARKASVEDVLVLADDNVVMGTANPFNGTLVSKKLFGDIGNIKKEMFIWGDEVEYRLRAQKFGYDIATITSALHYHPKSKTYRQDVFGMKIEEKKGNMSHVFYRNQAYKISRYESKPRLIWFMFKYALHVIVHFRSMTKLSRFWAYAMDGIKDKYQLPAILK